MVASQLSSGVVEIYSTNSAYAALKKDGSIIVWGDNYYGGNNHIVNSYLTSGVAKIL